MQTTRSGAPARWLGVGLADRYAPEPVPCAVCGLEPCEGGVEVRFWEWSWDPSGAALDVAPLQDEVRAARCVMIDGPQGLARAGRAARACEEAFRTPGRTPDHVPPLELPLGGRLRSSVELFAAFFAAKVRVSPVALIGGLCEVFPGAFWRGLERFGLDPLPEPVTEPGRVVRRGLLEALGVRFPSTDLPRAEQLDAAFGALAAAAADGAIRGVHARARGDGLFRTEDGFLREGPIVEVVVQGFRAEACREAFFALVPAPAAAAAGAETPIVPEQEPAPAPEAEPTPEPPPLASLEPSVPSPAAVAPAAATPEPPEAPAPAPAVLQRADALLDLLVARFRQRRPTVVTYAAAHALLFPPGGRGATRWSAELAQQVVGAATATRRLELPGLGAVALDTFVVDSTFKIPGRAHWKVAAYTVDAWRAAFGLPEVAGPGDLRLDPPPTR